MCSTFQQTISLTFWNGSHAIPLKWYFAHPGLTSCLFSFMFEDNTDSSSIRLWSKDLKHLIPGNEPPELQGKHILTKISAIPCNDIIACRNSAQVVVV